MTRHVSGHRKEGVLILIKTRGTPSGDRALVADKATSFSSIHARSSSFSNLISISCGNVLDYHWANRHNVSLGLPEAKGGKRYKYNSNNIMKAATAISSSLLIVGGIGPSTVQAFHLPMTPRSCLGTHHSVIDAICTTLASSANDDGDLDMEFEVRSSSSFRPETSFGAEAVPEEQRPANEYLDLIRQPLFGWASQETGSSGLAIRLAATYVGFYALV